MYWDEKNDKELHGLRKIDDKDPYRITRMITLKDFFFWQVKENILTLKKTFYNLAYKRNTSQTQ